MKIYISADLEGVNGIMHWSQTQPGEAGYERGVTLMHKELTAVIDGIYSTGAVTDVYVADAHWDGHNLRHELLPANVHLMSGWQRPYSMMSGVSGKVDSKQLVEKGFDGVFFVGYHARAGVSCGVLSHTYRASVFSEVKLNGVPVGETGLNAALAGYFGVPIAFLSGDDAACNEARNLLGALTCVPVKKAVSRFSAVMSPAREGLEALRHGAIEAIEKRDYWNIFNPPRPST
ncbi:MAG: M55 family metallopeptidase, partial [Candidatus Obscuribacterales bacterium]|nr:M55 family metallopeptidase [Candidatus Obscuribacterales bacterium]